MKQITGQQSKSSQPMLSLANQLHDGNMQALAENINSFFHQVAADLPPLSESSAPPLSVDVSDEFIVDCEAVELRMSKINLHKSPGPDGLQN